MEDEETLMTHICVIVGKGLTLHTHSTRMSPESVHKLEGYYMEGNRRYNLVHGFCFFFSCPMTSHGLPVCQHLLIYVGVVVLQARRVKIVWGVLFPTGGPISV